jgi:3-deoxy-D-manno-octulosonate 8-phosphate phosphatase (KDO 8-P phosphatase)
MGDDLPDLPVLQAAGLAVAVPNACTELRRIAHFVSQTPGGGGAVREVIELILRCQGAWLECRS